jgi:hypothetical protein
MVRLTNDIVNLGPGHLQLQADCTKDTAGTDACPDPTNGELVTIASQQILDADGNIVDDFVVSTFEYHDTHNHWHANNIAQFAVHYALDNVTGGQRGDIVVNDRGEYAIAGKVGFCLEDTYRVTDGKSPTRDRVYWDCEVGLQGIQHNWVDQYHHSLDDQEVDMTGAPVGTYYLVSTANKNQIYTESNPDNNVAWVGFQFSRDSKGNPKVAIVDASPCDSPGLCGDYGRNGP